MIRTSVFAAFLISIFALILAAMHIAGLISKDLVVTTALIGIIWTLYIMITDYVDGKNKKP